MTEHKEQHMSEKVESGLEVVAWAPSAVLQKLAKRNNNAPCVLTDGPAEFNDVALVRQSDADRALQLKHEAHRKTWRQLEQAVHWLQVAADALDDLQPGSALEQQIRATLSQQAEPERCTCPSGDGSLRWPCPTHKPAPAQDEQQPVAWMLEGAVGGSFLEFQQSDLFDSQRRYGGCMVPLYAALPATPSPAMDAKEE